MMMNCLARWSQTSVQSVPSKLLIERWAIYEAHALIKIRRDKSTNSSAWDLVVISGEYSPVQYKQPLIVKNIVREDATKLCGLHCKIRASKLVRWFSFFVNWQCAKVSQVEYFPLKATLNFITPKSPNWWHVNTLKKFENFLWFSWIDPVVNFIRTRVCEFPETLNLFNGESIHGNLKKIERDVQSKFLTFNLWLTIFSNIYCVSTSNKEWALNLGITGTIVL